ncbi:unnamed protein product [Sphenostylis stenocarpa]|uniref:Uncharacterized protein n=1 Tax=Sphenostylis stenocarpa TaxID=92480 RepID=A0AA86TNY7_9FABA|nr:unnamed protein product [Sphenostylis stenocarpa]
MANQEVQQNRPRQQRRFKARPEVPARVPLRLLLRVASVAGGIQFGWALQLSLLTPYVQQLGIPHVWASIIWLCGPLSGLLVQPLVGHLSDRCTSRFGRRRPFIFGGALSIIVAVLIIGHSADIGWWFGDTPKHRPWAVGVFVFGFWILDVANNVTQGPCRALLGDLTDNQGSDKIESDLQTSESKTDDGHDQSEMDTARINEKSSFFIATTLTQSRFNVRIGKKDYNGIHKEIQETLDAPTTAELCHKTNEPLLYVLGWGGEGPASYLKCKDHRRTRVANAYFSLFMAIGNILGYAAGSYSGWYRVFAFTMTPACGISCANLKSAFYLDIVFIAVTTYISIVAAHEVPLNSSGAHPVEEAAGESGVAGEAFMWELVGTFRYFSTPVWTILSVTALTWIGWFPFLLFDTDWMGREIYGGDPNEGLNYDAGVRMGAVGLLLNSVVLGITSVLLERLCRKRGPGFVWGISNILMAVCFIAMLVITYMANKIGYLGTDLPPTGIVIAALIIFTVLGFPLAVGDLRTK